MQLENYELELNRMVRGIRPVLVVALSGQRDCCKRAGCN